MLSLMLLSMCFPPGEYARVLFFCRMNAERLLYVQKPTDCQRSSRRNARPTRKQRVHGCWLMASLYNYMRCHRICKSLPIPCAFLYRALLRYLARVAHSTCFHSKWGKRVWEYSDLVLLDLGLPGMSGLEVCEKIRAESNLPIIVLSIKNAEHDKVRALDLGADDYVSKPFGINEVLARIRALS